MKIAVLTSSRADFGIYLPLLKAISNDAFFELDIIAFGTHLSHFHGHTIDQIQSAGFDVRFRVESMLLTDSKEAVATAIGLTMIKFSSFWNEYSRDFDIVLCLGDRYEMFAAVMAGLPFGIRFAHLHGGEKTLGAIDNVFRHAISHASFMHFTSTEEHKRRVLELSDNSDHVYNVGALSLDNILDMDLLDNAAFFAKWGINMESPTVLLTFHPETVNADRNELYAKELVEVINEHKHLQFLITMPNADTDGNSIRSVFLTHLSDRTNVCIVENLGTQSYFSAMKNCAFLLGNTSSGIIEAASFGKYVINLGNRQEGRTGGENIINTEINKDEISRAIQEIGLNKEFTGANIYRKNNTTQLILEILKTIK